MKKIINKAFFCVLIPALLLAFAVPAMADEEGVSFGTLQAYSTYTSGAMLNDSFYCNDAWFREDPVLQNDSLALLSMQMTAAGTELTAEAPFVSLLGDLGFSEAGISDNFWSNPDGCNYIWATKNITVGEESRTLLAVVFQSGCESHPEKEYGWTQNFTVNGDTGEGEHYALSAAADSALSDILALGTPANTTYWIMGHSRGGAIANLVAAHLPDANTASYGNIYAYTFESPNVVDGESVPNNASDYGYIHNYICSDDAVTVLSPWGMVRYGVDHQLDTEEANAELYKNLKELGSDAAGQVEAYDPSSIDTAGIMSALESSITSREDYSAEHNDTVKDAKGEETVLTYTYQDTLVGISSAATGGALDDFSSDVISKNADALEPVLEKWADAVKNDDLNYYWQAALELKGFLEKIEFPVDLSETECYVLMKALGPAVIDSGQASEVEGNHINAYEESDSLNEDALVLTNLTGDILSHHLDTAIARLHSLADMPLMDDLALVIPDPAVGDSVSAAPASIAQNISDLGQSWLSVSSEWNTDEETLQENRVYYLTVTVAAVAHTAGDDFSMTVNGNDPVISLEKPTAGGVQTVTGVYAFTLGEPEQVTVSFDAAGLAGNPDPIQVDIGSLLGCVIDPVRLDDVADGEVIWQFRGWTDGNGTDWTDVTADEDVVLYADWKGMVYDVDLSFEVPEEGETPRQPSIPVGVRYMLGDAHIVDSQNNEITGPIEAGDYKLTFWIYPESDAYEFLHSVNEYDGYEYTGSITLNGEEIEVSYNESENCLEGEYEFTVIGTDSSEESVVVTYSCKSGNGSKWTKGSTSGKKFVFVRSEADDTASEHFTGIKVDGKTVDSSNYSVSSGNVSIVLKSAYLEKLSAGKHTLTAVFDDGSAGASFTIVASTDSSDDSSTDSSDDSSTDSSDTSSTDSSDSSSTDSSDTSSTDSSDTSSTDSSDSSSTDSSDDSSTTSSSTDSTESKNALIAAIQKQVAANKKNVTLKPSKNSDSSSSSSSGSSGGSSATKSKSEAAKTGDDSNVLFWFVLMMAAAAVSVVVMIRIRKKL